MTDPTLGPDLLLRQYVWALLKANDPGVWDEDNYAGLIPIVPLSDEPELNDFTGPHIVYGYTGDTSGTRIYERSGTMTFAIYDENFRRLGKTINILDTAFSRADESARDVNHFLDRVTFDSGQTYPFRNTVRFGCIYIGFVEGGIPESTEGGRQSALFNIRFDYYVTYDVNTGRYDETTGQYVGFPS